MAKSPVRQCFILFADIIFFIVGAAPEVWAEFAGEQAGKDGQQMLPAYVHRRERGGKEISPYVAPLTHLRVQVDR